MKHIVVGCLGIIGIASTALSTTPAEARGGVNGSYARAYCQYYLNMASTAARGHSTNALAASTDAGDRDRGSAEYWRRAYRQCLKENGY